MKSLKDILPYHPFWNSIAPEYRDLLLTCAAVETFHAEQTIFRKGYDADYFYLIHEGKVALETPYTPGNGTVTVEELGPGEVMGWSWIFPPYVWHFSARALEPTVAVVFKANTLRAAARDNKAFGYDLCLQLGGIMLRRLQATRLRLLDLCEVPQ